MTPEEQLTLPFEVFITPEPDSYYQGLSHQDLPFHYALAELIDNSLSAYTAEASIVEIHIEKEGHAIRIAVCDKGRGISPNDLKNKVLRVGGQGTLGQMNEHGYGLKNALCVFTQNQRPWKIITRDQESHDNGVIIKVEGPFREGIGAVAATPQEWIDNIAHTNGDTGTRVIVETTHEFFTQIYPRNWRTFDNLIIRLTEHLGVLYRGFLHDRRNNIIIRYRDNTAGTAEWQEKYVTGIELQKICEEYSEHNLSIDYAGKRYNVRYCRGKLSEDKVNASEENTPFPLKIYYQSNQKTQGVDIRVRGKVIMTHQLEYIWQDTERHNSLNHFVGEIIVDDKEFRTVNNKSKLSPQDPKWDLIREKLEEEEYRPTRNAIVRTEEGIMNRLKEQLEHNNPGAEALTDYPTWEGAGVLIDIHLKQADDKIWIYELKKGTVGPLNVYQLIMYWDGKVLSGQSPHTGFLVGTDCPTSVRSMIEYWRQRQDAEGNHYNIHFKTIEQLMPPR